MSIILISQFHSINNSNSSDNCKLFLWIAKQRELSLVMLIVNTSLVDLSHMKMSVNIECHTYR